MDRDKMHEIANYYGWFAQLVKVNEELAELMQEVVKCQEMYLHDGRDFRYERVHLETDIVGEMADVMLMINQIAYLLSAEIAVDNHIRFKIERQIGRIEAKMEMERKNNSREED